MKAPNVITRIPVALAFAAVLTAKLSAQVVLPYTETFSSGSEGYNSSPNSGSMSFNNFTYSVDGTGGVGIFDLAGFLGGSFSNISGLGVIGDHNWSGTTARNVHNFTFASEGAVPFQLQAMDWVSSNGGPPSVFTVTGFRGLTQVAQVTGFDLSTTSSTTYGSGTANEFTATNIGPGGGIFGQHLAFSGGGWGAVDRIVLTATGNDILVGLDNIQMGIAAVPEPSHYAAISGLGLACWTLVRRRASRRAR